jgi:exonuclease III
MVGHSPKSDSAQKLARQAHISLSQESTNKNINRPGKRSEKEGKGSTSFNVGTWNLHGNSKSDLEVAIIGQDLQLRDVDVACLQETYRTEGETVVCEGGKMLFGEKAASGRHYGMGFYLSKSAWKRYHDHKFISNRIAIIRIRPNPRKKTLIGIINIYSPYDTEKEGAGDQFLEQLETVLRDLRKHTSSVFISGDWNAKLGKQEENDSDIMGRYTVTKSNKTKDGRDTQGKRMASFLAENSLYVSNTYLQHPMKHRSTSGRGQIDYIVMDQEAKHGIQQSRSYKGTLHPSDHRLVVTEVNLRFIIDRRSQKNQPRSEMEQQWPRQKLRDVSLLATEETTRDSYQREVARLLDEKQPQVKGLKRSFVQMASDSWPDLKESSAPSLLIQQVEQCLLKAAANTLPTPGPRQVAGLRYPTDTELRELCQAQKALKIRIIDLEVRRKKNE